MSQHIKPRLIIEWSPARVIAFQPSNGAVRTAATVMSAIQGMPTSDAVVALSRRTSFVRTMRVPNAGHAEVGLILRNQLENLFPVSGNELAYDFQLTDDVTSEGRLALVAAIQAESLRQVQEECRAAGVKVVATVPAAYGSVELMRTMGLRDAAVVQVDNDGASIDLIAQGVLKYSRWTAATRDVPGEVRRTFAAAGIEPVPILAAGGATLPADYHSSASTLLSLANIDLARPPLNVELAEAKAIREAQARNNAFRVSGLILAAGVAAAGFVGFTRYKDNQAVGAAVVKQERALDISKQEAAKGDKNVEAATSEYNVVARGFDPPQRFWEILAALTTDAPSGVWLTGITLERGKLFTLRGTAMSAEVVATYSQNLAHDERLRNVRLQNTNDAAIENRPVVEFSITGFPIGNLPLVDPPKSGSSKPASSAVNSDILKGAGQ